MAAARQKKLELQLVPTFSRSYQEGTVPTNFLLPKEDLFFGTMGGEFTYPNLVPLVLTHSHMNHPIRVT